MITPVLPTYARADLEFERGEGPWLITADGRALPRFRRRHRRHRASAMPIPAPRRRSCATRPASSGTPPTCYRVPGQERTRAARSRRGDLRRHASSSPIPAPRPLECAIKIGAQVPLQSKGAPGARSTLITLHRCLPRPLGRWRSIAGGNQQKYLEGFGPATPGFVRTCEWGDHEGAEESGSRVRRRPPSSIEVDAGRGRRPRHAGSVHQRRLRQMCDETRPPADASTKCRCGMGRTGKLFAHELAGVDAGHPLRPPRRIGGGFPFGACLMTEAVGEPMQPGSHGSTYGGNPLAMAVGNALLDLTALIGVSCRTWRRCV